jgi:Zn-dependent metalloprotease
MRCSIACIIPPVLLEELARRASDEERDALLRTLSLDASLRIARVHNSLTAERRNRATIRQSATAGTPQRTIYDCHGLEPPSDPEPVRAEGDPPSDDVTVNEAYDGLGDTYAFYWDQFKRDSIDDQGMPLHGWVHFGLDYDNAFWDGEEMVFGDGKVFDRFTKSLDVIGHELTHGVTEHEAGLQYLNQSGALNESVSDVFGSLVKQYKLGQDAEQADWLIGAEIRGPQFHGSALRSMTAPGTAYDDPVLGRDPQPADYAGFVHTTEDSGGVHINSGIPNRAFATLALSLGGPSWAIAGAVWYQALRDDRLQTAATFAQFAQITRAVAADRFGDPTAQAVAAAWEAVGVAVS